jgi:hypothetical protein
LFVAAEPFDPFLIVAVEEVFSRQLVGQARVPLSSVHRRYDDLAKPSSQVPRALDEAANVASDMRAASKQLSKPPVGMLEEDR